MPPSPRPSRSLRPIRALLTLIIISDILGLLVAAANWIGGGRTPARFWAPFDALLNPVPDPLQPAFAHRVDVDVAVTIADPTPAQTALENLAQGVLSTAVWLVIAVLARRIVASALRGDPFTVHTADRIRKLSITILVGGGLADAIRAGATYALYHSVFPSSPFMGPAQEMFDFWWLALGFAVLAFAAVVRHGCAMRAELDEVI
ncbi:DUF2975 domain-containing protein [Actinoplanes sp. NPDC049681]|uniref:DUF2975 domain-containing protein n=1 Tax=Actinoplanes sp. NPDC049681 TaxID=3363905 RepID=UPI0037A92D61